MTPHVIPLGTSEPQDFALINDGEAFDGTDFDVEIEVYPKGETTPMEDGPAVAWLNQSAGTVRVTGAEGLELGNYYVRFKVTDEDGKVGYFPNGLSAQVWSVVAIGRGA